jgi:hypothetical protein
VRPGFTLTPDARKAATVLARAEAGHGSGGDRLTLTAEAGVMGRAPGPGRYGHRVVLALRRDPGRAAPLLLRRDGDPVSAARAHPVAWTGP